MFVASRLPYLLKGMAFATALKLKKLNSEFAWTKKKQAVFSDVDFSLAQQEGQKIQMHTARPAEDSLNLFFFTLHWFMFTKFNKFLKEKMISNTGLRDNWSTVNLKKILRALLFLSFFCRKGWKSRWASVVKNRVCFFLGGYEFCYRNCFVESTRRWLKVSLNRSYACACCEVVFECSFGCYQLLSSLTSLDFFIRTFFFLTSGRPYSACCRGVPVLEEFVWRAGENKNAALCLVNSFLGRRRPGGKQKKWLKGTEKYINK